MYLHGRRQLLQSGGGGGGRGFERFAACKACQCIVGGSGGMPPQEIFESLGSLRWLLYPIIIVEIDCLNIFNVYSTPFFYDIF